MKENIKNISVILGIMLISSVIVLLLLTICIWKMDGGANFLSAGVIADRKSNGVTEIFMGSVYWLSLFYVFTAARNSNDAY